MVAEPKGGLTHVNFFKESEAGNAEEKANQERKKEEKEEQEKWERKVGISVALGQVPGGPLDKLVQTFTIHSSSCIAASNRLLLVFLSSFPLSSPVN